MTRFTLCLLCLIALSSEVWAQNLTVQQPVVGVFGVDTVVSVPDRGGAFLGGLNTGASGRNTAGPFRSGTSTGFSRSGSRVEASVYIHDFEAMDQALLQTTTVRSQSRFVPQSRADRAYAALLNSPPSEPITSIAPKGGSADGGIRSERVAKR